MCRTVLWSITKENTVVFNLIGRKNKRTWWGDRPAGAPPPSWPRCLCASCTQRVHGWGPAGPESAAGPGWWPARGAEWCSVPSRPRRSRSTCWRRCGRSPARRALGTGWLWRWAGGRCCETTWWLPPSAAGRTPRALYATPALSVNVRQTLRSRVCTPWREHAGKRWSVSSLRLPVWSWRARRMMSCNRHCTLEPVAECICWHLQRMCQDLHLLQCHPRDNKKTEQWQLFRQIKISKEAWKYISH